MNSEKTKSSLEIRLLKLLLLGSLAMFIAGIFTPMMTISTLIFIQSSFSVVSGLQDLLERDQYLLFVLISGLSIALPFCKILLLAWVLHNKSRGAKLTKLIALIHDYGRWAMLDVLVVAILLVSVKLGAIASVEVHFGLYWFAAAVLLTMGVTHRTVLLLEKSNH
ncbi:MAG: paraquat-inducible protein A [Osedax symbiont Rs2]|nr:MAG: paraquat-inducible protein A [Osedax symbiont Rs2]